MAKHIDGANISDAWVQAMEYLLSHDGKVPNLLVSIVPAGVGREIAEVRRIFDEFLKRHESSRIRRIDKVADTIFPVDLYIDGPGEDARRHLYDMQLLATKFERRYIKRGTYFDRLINWPGGTGNESVYDRNQLERHIVRLSSRYKDGTRNHNNYELAVSIADTDASIDSPGNLVVGGGDLRLQDPILDPYRAVMGFPCLSHISLTLFSGNLHLTALYRNQHFITKAYGNYVGLSNLQKFIALEVGCGVGELTCIATHADSELGDLHIPRAEILALVQNCRRANNDWQSKPT